MEKIKYVVHSDVDENNIYAEFDNMDEAIKYANDNIDSETWVDMVTCNENGEDYDYVTVWNYQDDGDPFSANFPTTDSVDSSDDPDYEEFAKQYEDITENCDIDFDEMQEAMEENEDEVECKICFERHPKPDCVKTPAGYVCKDCMEEALGEEYIKKDKVKTKPIEECDKARKANKLKEKIAKLQKAKKITEAAEKEKLEIPEDFEGQMDFLAADEDEAIKGYEAVLKVIEDEHIKGELEKIRIEEVAHKEFLEKIKTDPTAVYTEPLMDEESEEEESEEKVEESLDKKEHEINNIAADYEISKNGYTDEDKQKARHLMKNIAADSEISKRGYTDKDKQRARDISEEIKGTLSVDNIPGKKEYIWMQIDSYLSFCKRKNLRPEARASFDKYLESNAWMTPIRDISKEPQKGTLTVDNIPNKKEYIWVQIDSYLSFCKRKSLTPENRSSFDKYLESDSWMMPIRDISESKKECASKKDLKENLEDEIKDYLAYCKKEKLEAKDYKSLQKYMDAKNANLTEGDFVDDANADILDSQADKYEEEEKLRKETQEDLPDTAIEESAKDIIELDQDVKIGDVIKIIHLDGEDNKYDGKQGIVKAIDDLGQLHGTWGGLAVIPGVDEFEKVEMQTTIKEATEETPVRSDPSIDNIIASWKF